MTLEAEEIAEDVEDPHRRRPGTDPGRRITGRWERSLQEIERGDSCGDQKQSLLNGRPDGCEEPSSSKMSPNLAGGNKWKNGLNNCAKRLDSSANVLFHLVCWIYGLLTTAQSLRRKQ